MSRKQSWSSPNPNNSDAKFHGTPIIEDKHGKILRPITRGQQELLELIERNDIIFVNGPAGTGKTAIATWYGIAGIDAGEYDHLVLTRPIVEAGEELGFLPGTFDEKVAPYMEPLFSAIELVKGKKPLPQTEHKHELPQKPMKGNGKRNRTFEKPSVKIDNSDFYSKVTVCPLAYLRGSTKSKSFIILDEAQNVTATQMKLMLTRLGYGSKLVICGDISQTDLDRRVTSGFREAQNLLKGVRGIGFVSMGINDIVRHRLIKDIIIRYESKNSTSKSDVYSNREFIENDRDMNNYDFDDDDDYDDDDVYDDHYDNESTCQDEVSSSNEDLKSK